MATRKTVPVSKQAAPAAAKKAVAKKAAATKTVAKKAAVKTVVAKKAPVKTVVAKKVTTAPVAAKKAAATKAPVKKAPVKKAPAKKAPAKKAPATKAARVAASADADSFKPIPGNYKNVTSMVTTVNGVLSVDFGAKTMSMDEILTTEKSIAIVLEALTPGQPPSPATLAMLTALAKYLADCNDAAPGVFVACCP